MSLPAEIGGCTILSRLSAPGASFAQVYEAREADGTRVCVKQIHPNALEDVDAVLRFEQEIELAEQLEHINLLRVYRHGYDEGHYFVMEWVEGLDLGDLLRVPAEDPGRVLPAELVVYLGVEVCRALAYVHRSEWSDADGERRRTRGPVIHGDVSPSNVLVSREGLVRLADFGLSRALGQTGQRTVTEARGKLLFWAPEQFEGEAIGVETDLFALGLLLWRALIGTQPFAEGRPRGRRVAEWVAQQTVANGRRSVVEAAPDAPPQLQRVIEGLLKPRGERIGTAEELFETLRRIEPLDGHAQLGARVAKRLRARAEA